MIDFIKRFFANDLLIELSQNQIVVQRFSSDDKYQLEPYIAVEKSAAKSNKLDKLNVKAIGAEAKNLSAANIVVSNPFDHSGSFIAESSLAQQVILHCVQQMHLTGFKPAPRVVMHYIKKTNESLTDNQQRLLLELAEGAGAREAIVYLGERINVQLETFEQVQARIVK